MHFACDNMGCTLAGRLQQNTNFGCSRRDAHILQSVFNKEGQTRVPNKLDFAGCLI